MYVVDFLRRRRVWFEAFLHRPAFSATRLAQSLHVSGHAVAKSVLLKAGESFLLAVLPATSRIDLDRLASALRIDSRQLRLATEAELLAVFRDCEPGAVPAFGRLYGLRSIVDLGLAAFEQIVMRANTRHEGVRMNFRDFEGLEEPLRASFARPIAVPEPPHRGGHNRRNAG